MQSCNHAPLHLRCSIMALAARVKDSKEDKLLLLLLLAVLVATMGLSVLMISLMLKDDDDICTFDAC